MNKMNKVIRKTGLFPVLILLCSSSGSCKKEAPVTYANVTLNIALIDYNFGVYTAGTWSTATRIKIKYAGTTVDSLLNLYGAFNLPQSAPVSNPCSAHLNILSHSFRIQNNALNTLEISDAGGLRISYLINNSTAYFNAVSDSTTAYCPNSGCPLSIFAVR
ncbi:MAG: hypothetical protein ACHQRM_08240 [Bacteroidia bacterium]